MFFHYVQYGFWTEKLIGFYALIQWEKVTFKVDYVFLKEIKKMHCFQGEQDNT